MKWQEKKNGKNYYNIQTSIINILIFQVLHL